MKVKSIQDPIIIIKEYEGFKIRIPTLMAKIAD